LSNWDNPVDILESAKRSYHRDLWENQDTRVEVWIEKDALVGVVEKVCNDEDVPFFSCRGYVSDSEMWRAGIRARHYSEKGKKILFLHLGDHDPSGIDMTRDITERVELFSGYAPGIEIRRIALTMAQIAEVSPPPNPAKISDSRFESYSALYGDESWELDALEPQYIVNLIRGQIESVRDPKKWEHSIDIQEEEREQIESVIERWDEITNE
jgi:hypothetical protein